MIMKKNKLILEYCPNYYKIKNYDFDENDYITLKIIGIYEEYIFSIDERNIDEIEKIKELDKILYKYIDDYSFRKEVQKELLNIKVRRENNIIEVIVNNLIKLFESYEDGYTRNIYFARWI